MTFFSCNVLKVNPLNVNSLECVLMNNQECKFLIIFLINTTISTFYLVSVKVNKCSGSFNNINDPYAKSCF